MSEPDYGPLLTGHLTDGSAVSAGDLIGATPLVSALFHDEPTIEAMEAGYVASGVRNAVYALAPDSPSALCDALDGMTVEVVPAESMPCCYAVLSDGEIRIALLGDRRVVHQLEVAAAARQRPCRLSETHLCHQRLQAWCYGGSI